MPVPRPSVTRHRLCALATPAHVVSRLERR